MESTTTPKIDKQQLYGEWIKGERQRQRTNNRAIEKAMDLPPDDDVQITNTSTQNGMQLRHMLGIAAIIAACGGASALAVVGIGGTGGQPAQVAPPVDVEPIDLRIRWWVEDGEGQSSVEEVTE